MTNNKKETWLSQHENWLRAQEFSSKFPPRKTLSPSEAREAASRFVEEMEREPNLLWLTFVYVTGLKKVLARYVYRSPYEEAFFVDELLLIDARHINNIPLETDTGQLMLQVLKIIDEKNIVAKHFRYNPQQPECST